MQNHSERCPRSQDSPYNHSEGSSRSKTKTHKAFEKHTLTKNQTAATALALEL